MQIAAGVAMLEITATIMGRPNTIYPTLFWDDAHVVLVDSGYPGQLALFQAAMAGAGVPFDRLQRVILTHQDIDHLGGLPAMLEAAAGRIEVLAGAAEQPYIQGDRRPVKLTPEAIEQAVAGLPPAVPEPMRQAFRFRLEHPPTARVDRVLNDGEVLPYCGGITVIETPGHTPGHLCLYHVPSKTLVAGDAMTVEDGELLGPDPLATADMEQAARSLQKLAPFDIAAVICYHGGLYRGPANRQIARLARP